MSDAIDSTGGDEDRFLAAEYALGVLPASEDQAFRARVRSEPTLAAELSFWRTRLASLDTEFAETAAPASAWAGIERRLFAGAGRPGMWSSLALWRSFAGVAAAIAVVAIGVNIATPRPDPRAFAAQLVAALSAQGSNVSMVALYNATTGEVRLTALSGAAVPGKDYQLWAIEGSNAPKSMGLIKVDSGDSVKVSSDVLAGFGPGTTLAISLEPQGGSPTGLPTGPVVAAGKAAQI
ncbi:MAG TPA: anti-sigma factor [Devosia sp.]|jgi:anti-sigma-K factor RskA|nr:anti-sigma factor [Devosia sp.]